LKLKWIAETSNKTEPIIIFERTSTCQWSEKHNEQVVNEYSTVLYDLENGWLLFDSVNNSFAQINDFEMSKGNSIQSMKKLHDGGWNLSEGQQQKNKSFKEQLDVLRERKLSHLIYINWKEDQVKNFLQIMKTYIDTNLA
jgi:hypothetical protein